MKLEELNQAFEEEVTLEETAGTAVSVKKHSKKKWLILILGVLVLGGFALALSQKYKTPSFPIDEEIKAAEGGLVQEIPENMKKGEYGDILQQEMDDSMFTINVRSKPVFTNGTSKGTIDIVNNPSNKFPCKVVLTINDTGDEVYRCDDLIYPEQYIHEIKLTKNLEKGAYPATLTYYVYDEDGKDATGIMKAGITIVIQN